MTGIVSRKRSRDESAPVARVAGESSTQPFMLASRELETVGDDTPSWIGQLVRQNVSLQREAASLKRENELLRTRGDPSAELVRLREYAAERDAKVRELVSMVGQEVDLRGLFEQKYDDLKTHLRGVEHANSELVNHVRSQMSRLRTSRWNYGRACARSAAEQTHARLAGLAQASLTRAREHCLEQRDYLSLVSRASQVKTQLDDLDLMADTGVVIHPEDKARVQAKYDRLVREIEEKEMMDFSDREYMFAPGPCVLPSSFGADRPPSPLGPEEFGIRGTWAVEAFDSCPSESSEDVGDEAGNDPSDH